MTGGAGGAPERIGRYRVDDVIGAGAFATAYRAIDERLEATVVLKVLAENHSLNPDVRERFIAEGRSLRKVQSSHVVIVYDIGESDRQQPYLVLEYANRGTLAQRVEHLRAEGWTASAADVRSLAQALAHALEDLHAARIVHRDLSPSNVLLTADPGVGARGGPAAARPPSLIAPDERVLLADLGMCKDLALNSGLTVAGGTSGFRPPEMELGPAVIDTRADLWSVSALMRWLTAGADLPPELGRVLDRSLSLEPGDRHQDVGQWLADVEAALSPAAPDVPAGGHDVKQQHPVGSAPPDPAVVKRPLARRGGTPGLGSSDGVACAGWQSAGRLRAFADRRRGTGAHADRRGSDVHPGEGGGAVVGLGAARRHVCDRSGSGHPHCQRAGSRDSRRARPGAGRH